MAYDNSGTLSKRKEEHRKDKERSSTYAGKALIDGKQFYIDAWIKEGQYGKFFSLSFKPVNGAAQSHAPETRDYGAPRRQQQPAPQPQQSQQNGQRQGKYVPTQGVLDDEVPF